MKLYIKFGKKNGDNMSPTLSMKQKKDTWELNTQYVNATESFVISVNNSNDMGTVSICSDFSAT